MFKLLFCCLFHMYSERGPNNLYVYMNHSRTCFNLSAVLVVRVPFPFGVWDRMWNSIVSVPDHCLFIYCTTSVGIKYLIGAWVVQTKTHEISFNCWPWQLTGSRYLHITKSNTKQTAVYLISILFSIELTSNNSMVIYCWHTVKHICAPG